MVKGNAVGPTLYYGAGAGANATASAVVADIVDICRQLDAPVESRVAALGFIADKLSDTKILPIESITTAYYLRLQVEDKPGVMAAITAVMAAQGISIEAVLQKEPANTQDNISVVLLTNKVQESALVAAKVQLEALDTIKAPLVRIRVETLD